MQIFDQEIPTYAVVLVIVSAIFLGTLLSVLLWHCCRKHRKTKCRKQCSLGRHNGMRRSTGLREEKPKAEPCALPSLLDKVNIKPSLSLQPKSPVAVQPKMDPLTSVTSSTMSEFEVREVRDARLEERHTGGKIASIKVTACYCDKCLVLRVVEIRSLHKSINYQNAYVEMRKEQGSSKDALISVAVIHKGEKLKGRPETLYKFSMNLEDITDTAFNFYLWSTDVYSRYYQAGVCEFRFDASYLDTFANNGGCTMKGDFMITEEEDTTDSPNISLALRYINRTGKLVVIISSLANIPKVGWRSYASSLSDTHFLEPCPVVKLTLSHEKGKFRTTVQETEPLKGYNVEFHAKKFTFDVPLQELQLPGHVKLTVEVSHSNFKLTQSKIGSVEFSGQSTGKEGEHWREMIQMISAECQGQLKTHCIKSIKRRISS